MARSIEQHGYHIICALIGASCKRAACNYTSSLALWKMQSPDYFPFQTSFSSTHMHLCWPTECMGYW